MPSSTPAPATGQALSLSLLIGGLLIGSLLIGGLWVLMPEITPTPRLGAPFLPPPCVTQPD